MLSIHIHSPLALIEVVHVSTIFVFLIFYWNVFSTETVLPNKHIFRNFIIHDLEDAASSLQSPITMSEEYLHMWNIVIRWRSPALSHFIHIIRAIRWYCNHLAEAQSDATQTISKPKCRESLFQKRNVNIVLELVYKSSYADILQRQSSWFTWSQVRLLVFRILLIDEGQSKIGTIPLVSHKETPLGP